MERCVNPTLIYFQDCYYYNTAQMQIFGDKKIRMAEDSLQWLRPERAISVATFNVIGMNDRYNSCLVINMKNTTKLWCAVTSYPPPPRHYLRHYQQN